jgi:hypothetical protein
MMKHIALTGPIGSGKTTLSRALEPDYLRINFTDFLKQLAASCLSFVVPITLEDIVNNKPKYRSFLQEFGTLIGFDCNSSYITVLLESWERMGQPSATFDNIRFAAQAEYLKERGFHIVKLALPYGLSRGDVAVGVQAAHPAEAGIPDYLIDVVLDASLPIEELVTLVKDL